MVKFLKFKSETTKVVISMTDNFEYLCKNYAEGDGTAERQKINVWSLTEAMNMWAQATGFSENAEYDT